MPDLLETTEHGLFCATGGFYIDPWAPVERAVITHAHSDHARPGCGAYLTSQTGAIVLRERVGEEASIQPVAYGATTNINGVSVSLHPAGHILGSAQVRVEYRGEIWVVSGDYKTERDPTCEPFEPVRCHAFVTESTFGLPVYRWRPQQEMFDQINAWWRGNQARGWTSILYAYSLGKAQRLIAGLDAGIGPIVTHGAALRFVEAYRRAGVSLPEVVYVDKENLADVKGKALVIAPPSAANTPWLRKFGDVSTAFASGWMQIRGARRRRAIDRGFAISDHADWDGLLDTIRSTGAERVAVTHGYTTILVRWLSEQGLDAWVMPTRYEGEVEEPDLEGD
jgi:putative mRNA 3-end processing factor